METESVECIENFLVNLSEKYQKYRKKIFSILALDFDHKKLQTRQ